MSPRWRCTARCTVTTATVAPAEPPGAPAVTVAGPVTPNPFPTVWLLARGLGRRALARRRSRP